MSELLKKAFEAVGRLPNDDQDEIARMMLAMSSDDGVAVVPDEHRHAVAQGLAEAKANTLASDDDISAAWGRFGP